MNFLRASPTHMPALRRPHPVWFLGLLLLSSTGAWWWLHREPVPWGPIQISPDGRFGLVMFTEPSIPKSIGEFFGEPAGNPDGFLVLRYRQSHQEIHRAFRLALASRLPPAGAPNWTRNCMFIICDDTPMWPLPK